MASETETTAGRAGAGGSAADPEPQLAPPGAGIPALERAVVRLALPWITRSLPPARAVARVRAQLAGFGSMRAALGDEAAERRVLVPRLRGLEDSSRYWSLAMTLEHMGIVLEQVAELIGKLGRGVTDERRVGTADVKPRVGVPIGEGWGRFASAVSAYERSALDPALDLGSRAVYPHPWFGPQRVRTWIAFPVVHHGVHMEQCRRIVSALGSAGR